MQLSTSCERLRPHRLRWRRPARRRRRPPPLRPLHPRGALELYSERWRTCNCLQRGEGAPPGPVVPSHVAGLVKRILTAFRVGVPFEVLLSSSFHCTPEDLPSEVRRWLEDFCSSRLLKSCNELGNKQTVDLCKSEVDDILPMACCANYTFFQLLRNQCRGI